MIGCRNHGRRSGACPHSNRAFPHPLGASWRHVAKRLLICIQSLNFQSEYEVPTTIDGVKSLLATIERLSKAKRQEQRRLDDVSFYLVLVVTVAYMELRPNSAFCSLKVEAYA